MTYCGFESSKWVHCLAEARVLFDEYIPKLNSDRVQAINLFRSHPVVQRALFGADHKDVTMMIAPKSATQVE